VFPEAWAQLAGSRPAGFRVVDHYAALLRDPDPAIRAAAARRWDEWESTHVSLDPNWKPGPLHEDPRVRENFATLVTHYWSNNCFLEDDEIIGRAGELASTPGVLIHGRHDISGPAITPWLLHNAWPGSRLTIVESEGHGGPEEMQLAREAIDAFATVR
jgi:proline iminopeptidase